MGKNGKAGFERWIVRVEPQLRRDRPHLARQLHHQVQVPRQHQGDLRQEPGFVDQRRRSSGAGRARLQVHGRQLRHQLNLPLLHGQFRKLGAASHSRHGQRQRLSSGGGQFFASAGHAKHGGCESLAGSRIRQDISGTVSNLWNLNYGGIALIWRGSCIISSRFLGNIKVDTHWMFESGIMDVFVMLGPGPKDVSRQYGLLTGNTPLPPEFAIGYHQCRWNYNDQDDVRAVEQKFGEHDILMDVMWLDIEHTDGKKYFTWDGRKFSDSVGMTDNLTAHGRKLVTIVDPHIKKDSGYWVYSDLTDKDLWVKTKDGNNYDGWCWPGSSYYPDFLNPEAREYFAEQYRLENYKGSTLDTYTWNDMNEPSVFNGPEVTMPKDVVHPYGGGWEHRDLHNMYGFLYTIGTNQGHLLRSDNQLRPFILTRSAYAGSQRFAAIWTGDNKADWGHLESSIPMCLSLGVAGMSFCGADVGGFFGNPDGELFVRWYQAAAFQPFFRSHAHIDTKRREPWLFSAGELSIIRKTIRARYSFLPMWYTLFYEGERFGVPPMRPLWYEFPEDEGTFDREGIHMIGSALLVAPVMKSSETKVTVYFPGNQLWYDIWTGEKIDVHGEVNVAAPYDKIPVYQKGGTIIPRRERIRRSATLMHNDPVTLYVAPDKAGHAEGTLYLDDGKSYTYREGKSIYVKITYDNGNIQAKLVDPAGAETKVWLEKVVIQGVKSRSGECKVKGADGEVTVEATYDNNKGVVVVRKPAVNMATEWTIQC